MGPGCELSERNLYLPARSNLFKIREFFAHLTGTPSVAAGDTAITGHLVLCTADGGSGFWGPISHDIAVMAAHFADTTPWSPSVPVRGVVRHILSHHRHAHTGLALVAATALEYAAWDFAAKQRSVPVWRLLSDRPPPPCGIYATFFGLENAEATVSELVATHALESHVKKIGAEKAITLEGLANATGTALSSWAIDFKARYGLDDARKILHRLPDDLAWIEEPLPPHEIDLLELLQTCHPIAAGEHFYTVFEFSSARKYGVSIFQPDPVFTGGLDHYIRIASSLSRYGDFYPHGNGLVPALHAAGMTTKAPVLEFHFGLEAKRQVLWRHKIIPDKSATLDTPHQPGWLGDMCETVRILE